MPDYDNTNKGVVFLNEKTNDKQPDFKGRGNFQGSEFELSMWERTSKDGKSYYSISFSKPYKKAEGAWEQQRQKFAKKDEVVEDVPTQAEIDDDILKSIPF